ncbi:class I SAM-dependent methyltransferase [Deltaproteobacteria bacterium TL4]
MIQAFKRLYRKEAFQPSWLSVLINPYYFVRRRLFERIKANAERMTGVMLDFGCGDKPYEHLFQVNQYIGLDIQESGHDHQNETIDVFYDGKTLPFEDHAFDCVFSSEVLEHIFNSNEVLDELYRVLKPGGTLFMTVPFVWEEHEIPYDFARYTSFGLVHLLEGKGFQVMHLEKTGNSVETIFQLWNAYLAPWISPKTFYLRFILNLLLIAPVTLLGLVLSKCLPDHQRLYLSNLIIVQKPR